MMRVDNAPVLRTSQQSAPSVPAGGAAPVRHAQPGLLKQFLSPVSRWRETANTVSNQASMPTHWRRLGTLFRFRA